LNELLQGEEAISLYKVAVIASYIPTFITQLAIKLTCKDPERLCSLLYNLNKNTSGELFECLTILEQEKMKFIRYLKDNNIDLIIMPTLPTPAPLKDTANDLTPLVVAYTTLWNGLDFPAGTIPYTLVNCLFFSSPLQ